MYTMDNQKIKLTMEELEKIHGGEWYDHLNEEEKATWNEIANKLDASITTPTEYYDWEAILAEANAFKAAMIEKYGDD